MRVLTIANQKGGIAKTTTTLNMSEGLRRAGKRVLVVDLDSQGDLSNSMSASEPDVTFAEAIQQGNIAAAIQQTEHSDIIPASLDLLEMERQNYNLDFSGLNYDYIVIDCPPNMSGNTMAALRASDGVIIPTTADFYSYKSVRAIAESIKYLRERAGARVVIDGILLTRTSARMIINQQITADLKNLSTDLHTKLYNTFIRESVAIRESQLMQQNIFDYDLDCNAAQDYHNFVLEYLEGAENDS